VAYSRPIDVSAHELLNIDAHVTRAIQCLKPLIIYLEQNAYTAADQQALINALDLRTSLTEAQAALLKHHPDRR